MKVDINKVAKNITLEIEMTGIAKFNIRTKIAVWLFRLGSWIAPFNVDIKL
jgi:hypothetical protein